MTLEAIQARRNNVPTVREEYIRLGYSYAYPRYVVIAVLEGREFGFLRTSTLFLRYVVAVETDCPTWQAGARAGSGVLVTFNTLDTGLLDVNGMVEGDRLNDCPASCGDAVDDGHSPCHDHKHDDYGSDGSHFLISHKQASNRRPDGT